MFPMRYELEVYILEDCIHHSHRCENLKPYISKYSSKSLRGPIGDKPLAMPSPSRTFINVGSLR
jgi:hypothetical protein